MIFDETDKAFIADVYPDRTWTVDAIAKALDKTPEQIRNYVKYRGLTRTDSAGCLTDTDKAFIEETFTDPAWTVSTIAEKLDVRQSQVRAYAYYKELKRPHGKRNPPTHDWQRIWELSQTGLKKQRDSLSDEHITVLRSLCVESYAGDVTERTVAGLDGTGRAGYYQIAT